MASVFLYHVVGDLTVGKPEMVELCETESLEAAISAIGESTECGISVWKRKSHVGIETNEMRQQRFEKIYIWTLHWGIYRAGAKWNAKPA